MLQNHKTKNQLVFLTMSTSFVTLFWIEFFTNFFTDKNKSYKSAVFNSENSGFILWKLVVGSAEQDTYFSVCFFCLCANFHYKGVFILNFYIKLQGLVHWLAGVFFCLIQLMERATFRIIINVGQLSLSAQSCVLTKILSDIQQFLKCHFTPYIQIRQRYSIILILFFKITITTDKIL